MYPDWSAASIWIVFTYPNPKNMVGKLLMLTWYYNWRPWTIHQICREDEHYLCSRFDELLHNGSTLILTSLIHCGSQQCFHAVYDQCIGGEGSLPTFSLFCPRRKKLGPNYSLDLTLLFCLGTLCLHVILRVRSWKPYNLVKLPFLFSTS